LGADQETNGNAILIEEDKNQNWEEETTKTCDLSSHQKEASLKAAVTKATPTPPEGSP
jgi:hypothetical protein